MSTISPTDKKKAGIAAVLFKNPDLPVFGILDGASAPALVKNLYQHEPEYCCLYRGELAPDVALTAPYLVRLEPDGPFTEFVLQEGWGKHWGIFMTSNATLRTLRDHFRNFHAVELPDQRTVIFRYYDPRVLGTFLPATNAPELASFFGAVENFFIEAGTPENYTKFSIANKNLKVETLPVAVPPK